MEYRLNILNINSIDAFLRIRGSVRNNCKDIYFLRALGVSKNLDLEICKADEYALEEMSKNRIHYTRIKTFSNNIFDIAGYISHYEYWLETGKNDIKTKIVKPNSNLSKTLSNALREAIKLYSTSHTEISSSIEKNLIVKMLFWFDDLVGKLFEDWNENFIIKIIAENIFKEQEYLFFYLLTRLGADVLILECEKDIEINESLKSLSRAFTLGEYSKINLSPFIEKNIVSSNVSAINIPQVARATNSPLNFTHPRRGKSQTVVNENNSRNVTRNDALVNSGLTNDTRQEKSFEEIAKLASSIVMIDIYNERREVIGTGSGIMIGSKGYILTNHHVAAGGHYYGIRIEDDDNIYETDELIKYNNVLDLAVIRINKNLKPLKIYNGERLVRGQKVVAIGSPLGLFNSVSDGIISGFREIEDVEMIQFTAPISHGSSGGAVLNMFGEVIGISTAGIDNGQNINLAVGYEFILRFAKGFLN